MRDEDAVTRNLKVKQGLFFAALEKRSMTIAGVAAACGMSPDTLGSYKPRPGREPSAMSLPTFIRLATVVPADLMSLLIEESGHQLTPIDAVQTDWLTLGERAAGFAAKVCKFQATGGHIDHREDAELREDILIIVSEGQGAAGVG